MSPSILGGLAPRFRLIAARELTLALTLKPSFYVDYMMTETNVAAAVRRGNSEAEIRSWCETTLTPVWRGEPHEVLFDCYFACLICAAGRRGVQAQQHPSEVAQNPQGYPSHTKTR